MHEYWERLLYRDAENYRDSPWFDDRYGFAKDDGGHEVDVIEERPT